jgi:hypothetical protein
MVGETRRSLNSRQSKVSDTKHERGRDRADEGVIVADPPVTPSRRGRAFAKLLDRIEGFPLRPL